MQLYALGGGKRLLADHAKIKKHYRCPECLNLLELKLKDFPHFIHLKDHSICLQHLKSLAHLQILWLLNAQFPKNALILEELIPDLGIAADALWADKKIAFQILCKKIPLQNILKISQGLQSLGWTIVWILHDKCFNQKKLCPLEQFLKKSICYYTDGKNSFYDQFEICLGDKRLFRGRQIKVDLKNFYSFGKLKETLLPTQLLFRLHHTQYYFEGDLMERTLRESPPVFSWKEMKELEQEVLLKKSSFVEMILKNTKRHVVTIWRHLLESLSS